jgi:cholesterol transport system auxiliary component
LPERIAPSKNAVRHHAALARKAVLLFKSCHRRSDQTSVFGGTSDRSLRVTPERSRLEMLAMAGRASAAAALAFALVGCVTSGPPMTFNLSAPTNGFTTRAPRGTLSVAVPSASAPVDSDRVVVRTGGETIAFLKGAQWVSNLPGLVQDRLIESFENARFIKSVVRPTDGLSADYTLTSEIRRFDIDARSGEAVVQIAVKLASAQNGRVVAGEIFTGRGTGSAQDPGQATHALNDALDQVLRQIVAWAGQRA